MLGKKTISCRNYLTPKVSRSVTGDSSLLAGSVILTTCTTLYIGHEIGEIYDFTEPQFNHDWKESEEEL